MPATSLRPRAKRVATFYVGAWLLGAVLVVAAMDPRLTGFGLGLMDPGVGLAYHGHWPRSPPLWPQRCSRRGCALSRF